MVGATGFEPATSCSQSKCSSQAELRSGTAFIVSCISPGAILISIKNQFAKHPSNLQNSDSTNYMKKTGFVIVLLAGVTLFGGCKTASTSAAPKTASTTGATKSTSSVNPAGVVT